MVLTSHPPHVLMVCSWCAHALMQRWRSCSMSATGGPPLTTLWAGPRPLWRLSSEVGPARPGPARALCNCYLMRAASLASPHLAARPPCRWLRGRQAQRGKMSPPELLCRASSCSASSHASAHNPASPASFICTPSCPPLPVAPPSTPCSLSPPLCCLPGIEKHGGRVLLRAHVEKVLVEGGRAAGVALRPPAGRAGGRPEVIRAQRGVISNASVWDTMGLLPQGGWVGWAPGCGRFGRRCLACCTQLASVPSSHLGAPQSAAAQRSRAEGGEARRTGCTCGPSAAHGRGARRPASRARAAGFPAGPFHC